MPTRRLPAHPDIDQLKRQAKDLLAAHASGGQQACQRIREFHPALAGRPDAEIRAAPFALSDAQLAIAREYGFASWARLRAFIGRVAASELDRPHHERVEDPVFRRAVDLLDDGDVDELRRHLARHPHLARQRVRFEGGNYFRNPSLLAFVAENPVRHDSLPPNIVEVAAVILDAGADQDQTGLDDTLQLVCSGRVAREAGVQNGLIDLLCRRGASPDAALRGALGHGELAAAQALVDRGARVDLPVVAATGRIDEARRLLAGALAGDRHLALAWAAQFGHVKVVRLLLDAGEDVNRYNPPGAHAHSTPLHQAALAGHLDVVRLLVARGARLDLRDTHHQGTALDWAEYGGRAQAAALLRATTDSRSRDGR